MQSTFPLFLTNKFIFGFFVEGLDFGDHHFQKSYNLLMFSINLFSLPKTLITFFIFHHAPQQQTLHHQNIYILLINHQAIFQCI